MTQQLINIGLADKGNGDPLRTAFNKVNQNFTELYNQVAASVVVDATAPTDPNEGDLWWDPESGRMYVYYGTSWVDASPVDGAGISSTNQLVNGAYSLVLESTGALTANVQGIVSENQLAIEGDGLVQLQTDNGPYISVWNESDTKEINLVLNDGVLTGAYPTWTFGTDSTLTVPSPTSDSFRIRLSSANFVPRVGKTSLTLTGEPWDFYGAYAYEQNGEVQLVLDTGPLPSVTNPGYVTGDEFTFDASVHGVSGYTLSIVLDDVVFTGGVHWTANLTANAPPDYPSTIKSDGAIKLTSNETSWVFGTDGKLTTPSGLAFGGSNGHAEITNTSPDASLYIVNTGLNQLVVEWTAGNNQLPVGEDVQTAGVYLGVSGLNIGLLNDQDVSHSWQFAGDGSLRIPGDIRSLGNINIDIDPAGPTLNRWTFGTTGNITFPDTSTYGNSTLTGAVDSDLALEVKHRTTVSAVELFGASNGGLFTADITTNDDITVVQPYWQLNVGSELAPIWIDVLDAGEFSIGTYNIFPDAGGLPEGFEFVQGQSYTFRNPVPVAQSWTINSQNGTLIAPGNAILSNETADLGEGDTYRDFSIELPTVDGQNEKRWSFINDGRLLLGADAGAIYADQTSGRVSIGDSIADGGAPTMPSNLIHIGGGEALVISRGNGTNNPSWTFGDDGNTTLPVASSLVVEGTTYTQLADAETTYTDNELMYQDALTQWMTDAAFKPVWYALSGREAYDIIMAWTTPDGITPPPSNLVPIANACKNSYLTWQDLIAESKLAVKSDTTSFEFDSAGKLTLPHGGTIAGGDPTAVQAAYDAWYAMEDDWTYLITDGGTNLIPRPWTYAAPDQRQATLTSMWSAQQGTDTLDWAPISLAFYQQVRAWLAINTNSAALYDEWKKLSTSVNITAEDSTWAFTNDGAITFPDDTVQTTAFTKNITSDNGDYYLNISNTGLETGGAFKWLEDTTERVVMNYVAADDRFVISTSRVSNAKYWYFGDNGNLQLPTSGDIIDSTGVSQTAKRVEGSWTVTSGTNTYSFTVPMDGTYTMWVKGNIPNGIITWNATLSVTNSNVPAIGTQYAWNYTGGGSPILLTTIPDQIRGTAGTISTDATYAGTTSNRFDFGISNTSGASVTVYYGYTKV